MARSALIAAASLCAACASASAQDTATTLPSGLVRQGNVVMMQPIADYTDGTPSGPAISRERRASAVRTLSTADHGVYTSAFDAADRGDWIAAKGLADQGHDPIARRLIQWRYVLDKNSGASFAEINAFLKANPDWPARDALFARAEAAMDANMDPHAVIAWFGDRTPVSGIGKVRLGEAQIATGDSATGQQTIRDAWIENSFDPQQEFAIVQRHGDILTPDVDRQRLSRLIWRNDLSAARREMSRVSSDVQQVAQARLTLQTNPSAGLKLADELPASLRDEPGILFDRARTLRRQGSIDAVPSLLEHAPTREMAKVAPARWWAELNLATRQALQDSNYHSAYLLASNNGLSDGTPYAEAEFLAGWIALRYLHDPQNALTHFTKLVAGVSYPISVSRGHYWQGRAAEAAGDMAGAWTYYKQAAVFSETFYGELAQARIDPAPMLHLRSTPVDTAAARPAFEQDDMTRAIRVLADIGVESLVRTFAMRAVENDPSAKHADLLAQMLVQLGFPEVAVRVAKQVSYGGVVLSPYLHPVIPLPAYHGADPVPEPALVLGIIRQETEFDPDAVSGAGARGIMQLMPSTAKASAARAGVAYRPSDLTRDTDYNIELGMAELSNNLQDWGGSYILTAAAYNAGPNNVKKWIAQNGDPRNGSVDPLDWIELIPFSETRNYVMRVIENTEVYRDRLLGQDQPLRVLADLYRPATPPSSVLHYVPPAQPALPPGSVPSPEPRPDTAAVAPQSAEELAARVPTPTPAPAPSPTPKPVGN